MTNNNTTYKNNAIGLIPSDWEVKKLGEILVFKNGLNKEKEFFGSGTPIVNYKDVYKNNYLNANLLEGRVTVNSNELKNFDVKKGDVFFTRTSETIEEIGLSSVIIEDVKDTVFSGFILRGRPITNDLDMIYCVYCFNSEAVRREITTKSTHTTRALTNGTLLSDVNLLVPPLLEQQKIASILSTWDTAIDNCKSTIEEMKVRNKGLTQKLLTGKMRVKGFDEKWQVKAMNECMSFTPRPITKPTENYLALGLRSHGKGVFHKTDFDPTSIAMETMYEVKENDLIINITFAWEQAVAIVSKKDEGGLVSHRFPTYTFNDKNATPDFFRHYILQKRFKFLLESISPGGAGRNRVMSKTDFLKLELKLPNVQEQKAIATILD
ncbi:restriction endonuclease subunit S, partial [Flavobacterium sp.]|uniref:restriction endonuclease subunit S n=1 Tax=Flavobacterium sp. TaxID=239 RepID=UPI0025BDFC4E